MMHFNNFYSMEYVDIERSRRRQNEIERNGEINAPTISIIYNYINYKKLYQLYITISTIYNYINYI